ncbi:MAG: OmpA family protein [Saprospirales bacterium]|nr:OmpA family protein [Saprospirales bacterium]
MNKLIFIFLLMYSCSMFATEIEGGGINDAVFGGLKKADQLYKNLEYKKAIPFFEAYLKKNNKDIAAWNRLGDCFRLTSDFEKAANSYSIGAKNSNNPNYILSYAQMLQAIGKIDDAKFYYSRCLQEDSTNIIAINQLNACNTYSNFLLSKDRYDIKNLAFNSPGYDFSPTIYKDGLIFASSRDSSKAIQRVHTWTGTTFFDLYFIKGTKTNFEKNPSVIKKDGSTKYHEGVVAITPEGKVYFTRNNFINGKKKNSADKITKQKMYVSTIDGQKFEQDLEFEFDNNEYNIGHPSVTTDGKTMFFVSDMPNGFGGKDIYYTTLENGKWVQPTNLGADLNTIGNEMFPIISEDGLTLYFSSNGHSGMGGLDIFKSKKLADGTWTQPKNMGAPLNSSYDDFSLIFAADKTTGYFTSNRPDGHGLDDIYSFTDYGIDLEGIVVDSITKLPICNSNVQMNASGNPEGKKTTKCDGYFEFSVLRNMDYCFDVNADDYFPNNSICATTKNIQPGQKVFVRIPLLQEKPAGLTVQVIDKKTKLPIDSASIILADKCDGTIQTSVADKEGKSCFKVKCNCDFEAIGNARGYLPSQTYANTKDKCEKLVKCGQPIGEVVIVELDKLIIKNNEPELVMPKGYNIDSNGYIELKDIYYDFDKWYIRKESETELYKLLSFLIFNPDAIVEIASHTDARAPFDYNIKLSQRRAQSVVNWLADKGITRDRMQPKGYGETKLRNNCADDVKCSEDEHQRNRRTEFKVIGTKINISSDEKKNIKIDPCLKCPF